MLEYVPVGARNARRELVAEMFPTSIVVADEMEPAVYVRGVAEHFVSDGLLYSPLTTEPTTIEEVEASLSAGRLGGLTNPEIFRQIELVREGVRPVPLEAQLRGTVRVRTVTEDGRMGGAAAAQRLADTMRVFEGQLYHRSQHVPLAYVMKQGHRLEPVWMTYCGVDHYHEFDATRLFHLHDQAELEEVAHLLGGEVPELFASQVRWTDAGALAFDMQSLSVQQTAWAIGRRPIQSGTLDILDGHDDVLDALLALRRELAAAGDAILPPAEARELADRLIGHLAFLRGAIGHDMRAPFKRIAIHIDRTIERHRSMATRMSPEDEIALPPAP